MNKIVQFYTGVVTCPLQCRGIINDPKSGIIPRGFYFGSNPKTVDILVVGKNPGHPLQAESKKYKNEVASAVVDEHIAFVDSLFFPPNGRYTNGTQFHKNVVQYLSFFLGEIPEENVFQNAAYTNLVKCSFRGEENDRLQNSTIADCLSKHFLEEIKLFNPKVILACGREVENSLRRNLGDNIPIIYIKHPSYHYKSEDKTGILSGIRKEIQRHIKASQ